MLDCCCLLRYLRCQHTSRHLASPSVSVALRTHHALLNSSPSRHVRQSRPLRPRWPRRLCRRSVPRRFGWLHLRALRESRPLVLVLTLGTEATSSHRTSTSSPATPLARPTAPTRLRRAPTRTQAPTSLRDRTSSSASTARATRSPTARRTPSASLSMRNSRATALTRLCAQHGLDVLVQQDDRRGRPAEER